MMVPYIILGATLVLVVFFVVGSRLVIRMQDENGGWNSLVGQYRWVGGSRGGVDRAECTGWLGDVYYRGTLLVGCDGGGLHLRQAALFSSNRSSVYVPWSDVVMSVGAREKFRGVSFSFARVPGVQLWLREGRVGQLREMAEGNMPEVGVASCQEEGDA